MDISENPQFTTRGIYSEYLDDSCNDLVDWASYNHMNYARFLYINNPENLKKKGLKVCGGGHNVLFRFMDPDQEYPYKHIIYGGEGKPEDPYTLSNEYLGDLDGDGKLSYIEAHPEWYPLVNGKRKCFRNRMWAKECYFTGDNFCTTNKDAVTELCKLIVNDLVCGEWSKLDFLDFWMLDNGHWCECEECKKSGNLTYKMIMVVYSLDKAIKAAIKEGRLKRDVRILFPAYHETLPAPDFVLPIDFDYKNCLVTYFPIERCYVHNIDDENCTETNQMLLQKLLPWLDNTSGNYKGEVFIGEYYNVSSFVSLPIVLSQRIMHDIPYYFSKGVKHFYYMHMTAGKWSVLTLNNYLYAKLLWNPEVDCQELMSEFFKLYYKEVSNEMTEFYTLLEKATSNMKYLKHYQEAKGIRTSIAGRIINKSDDLFPFKHMQYDFIIDDPNAGISLVDVVKLFDQCRYLLDSIILKAHNELVIERLILDDMRLIYGEYMVKFYYSLTKMNLHKLKGRNNLVKSVFKTVKLYAESLRGMTEPLDCYYHGNEFKNGLSATWIDKEYNKLVEEYEK